MSWLRNRIEAALDVHATLDTSTKEGSTLAAAWLVEQLEGSLAQDVAHHAVCKDPSCPDRGKAACSTAKTADVESSDLPVDYFSVNPF